MKKKSEAEVNEELSKISFWLACFGIAGFFMGQLIAPVFSWITVGAIVMNIVIWLVYSVMYCWNK